jgi:small-conductance mechanosensitive channel
MERWVDIIARHLHVSPLSVVHILWTLVAILTYFALRLLVHNVLSRRTADVSRQYLMHKTVNYLLGFALVFAIIVIWVGKISGVTTYLGILSAGLAIALQDPLTDFAGWIFIATRKPFVVGDRIQIGTHAGDVIDVRLFQFSLVEIGNWVDADQSTGRIIHIPNGWVFKHSTANYVQGFNFIWNEIPVTVTFESNWKKAKEILTEVSDKIAGAPGTFAQEQIRRAARKYMIHFQHLTPIVWITTKDNGVTLTIRYLCEPRRRRSSETSFWEEILTRFHAEPDIDLAYPTTRFFDNAKEGKPQARAGT